MRNSFIDISCSFPNFCLVIPISEMVDMRDLKSRAKERGGLIPLQVYVDFIKKYHHHIIYARHDMFHFFEKMFQIYWDSIQGNQK